MLHLTASIPTGRALCVRYAAKIRILDTHILHHYTPGTGLSEPIYLGVYGILRKNSFWGEGVGHERI
jgi:hypothetical protein